jgi:hypothetical protein
MMGSTFPDHDDDDWLWELIAEITDGRSDDDDE